MNRSIVTALNSHSIKYEETLEFHKPFEYLLLPVPSNIYNGDDIRRCKNKCKLKEVLLVCIENSNKTAFLSFLIDVSLVDHMVFINTVVSDLPST